MTIGRMTIPDVAFSPEIEKKLEEYTRRTGDTSSYISEVGVDSAGLTSADPGELRLFASIEYLKEDPENGLAALNVALAFDCLGQIDNAVQVLETVMKAGNPGLYPEQWDEDPEFLSGFWLADAGRLDESLAFYDRCMKKQIPRFKGPILGHIGSVLHEQQNFDLALTSYSAAVAEYEGEAGHFDDSNSSKEHYDWVQAGIEEQLLTLKHLIAKATSKEVFPASRWYSGLQITRDI